MEPHDPEQLKPFIENCIWRAFEKHIPKIIEECQRQDEITRLKCAAHNLFSDVAKADEYKEIVEHYKRKGRRNILIAGFFITAINAGITFGIRSFF